MAKCSLCPNLCATRSKIVDAVIFGKGLSTFWLNPGGGQSPALPPVKLLVVGEAPGKSEDVVGEPFVGASGSILRDALAMAGADMRLVAFTNAVRCWPGEGNRTPTDSEVDNCNAWLDAEIEALQPSVILVAGKVAERSMGMVNGFRRMNKFSIDVCIVVQHPAYVMRQPRARRKFYEGVAQAVELAGISRLPRGYTSQLLSGNVYTLPRTVDAEGAERVWGKWGGAWEARECWRATAGTRPW